RLSWSLLSPDGRSINASLPAARLAARKDRLARLRAAPALVLPPNFGDAGHVLGRRLGLVVVGSDRDAVLQRRLSAQLGRDAVVVLDALLRVLSEGHAAAALAPAIGPLPCGSPDGARE